MLVSYVLNLGSELVGKKWRAVLIWHLKDGPLRFSEIKRMIPDISVKVLTEVLKEMQENGLITRTQFSTIPVKVVYEIHPNAKDFVYANTVCVIKIAEYVIKNQDRHNTESSILSDLKVWVDVHKHKLKIHISPDDELPVTKL
jgi:DNA-binding HxlR family transcriptional regulator